MRWRTGRRSVGSRPCASAEAKPWRSWSSDEREREACADVMLAWMPVAPFDGWENAFVATSIALGVTLEEACASLDDAALARTQALVRRLGPATRDGRARALAGGLAPIAIAIERTRLA